MKTSLETASSIFAATLALCLIALPATAGTIELGSESIPLSQLLDDGRVVVGDKEFSNFTYNRTGDMPQSQDVNVIPIEDDGQGNYGIRFQGAFVDHPASPGGSDALITYDVTVLDPMYLITDAHISGNPARVGEEGAIQVVETFNPLGSQGEFRMEIFDDSSLPDGQQVRLTDWTFFDRGYTTLSVQKDILGIAINGSGMVTMSFVDQSFSQMKIPEPAAAGLLLGLMGAVVLTRYRLG